MTHSVIRRETALLGDGPVYTMTTVLITVTYSTIKIVKNI